MKHDEFAFFNQQLANMLRDGIPLEGALAQLCEGLRRGRLRAEAEALHAALAAGTPLDEALAASRLPPLYTSMTKVGVRANNLPAVLTMLADHYRHVGAVSARLKGLLVYPAIVLVLALALSLFLAFYLAPAFAEFTEIGGEGGLRVGGICSSGLGARMVVAPATVSVLLLLLAFGASLPPVRRWVRWRLSPLKEASLGQLASGMALMLRGGCPLADALALQRELERGTLAGDDLARIGERLAAGATRFAEMSEDSVAIPRLFTWLVENAGEDMAGGFERAAELYRTRASHRTEMLLYAALPCSVLVLGGMLLTQVSSVLLPLLSLMRQISGGM